MEATTYDSLTGRCDVRNYAVVRIRLQYGNELCYVAFLVVKVDGEIPYLATSMGDSCKAPPTS